VEARQLKIDRGELGTAMVAVAATALIALVASYKLGIAGLLAPLGIVLLLLLLRRPVVTVGLVVGLVIACEGPTFGILTFTSHLYTKIYGDLGVLDVLVAVAVLAVGLDLVRSGRALQIPRALRLPSALLALAMVAGFVTGHAAGGSLRFVLASEDVLAFLLVLASAGAKLDIDRDRLTMLLYGAVALAIVKAVLGLLEIAGGYGQSIEAGASLTYREPTSNWLIMITLLALFAGGLARARPPLWMLLGSPLLVASLLLSYRRSFWIAFVLAALLVLLLGLSPLGRRLLLPAAVGIGIAIWLAGSIQFQSQLPVAKRVASLQPSRVEANVEDRYRLDERANVLGEIGRHPITGLGMTVPWAATDRPLPVEHAGGREYVHFAALWFWLKLGILGLLAYIGFLCGSGVLAWQAWRRSRETALSAFGLASLCGIVGLVVIETTATFTGVDARFTVLLGVQIGLLALLARPADSSVA
jgi:O-antigen ligase